MFHCWQFAANGAWEEALSVDAIQPIDVAMIERWVAQVPQDVAFEAVFAENGVPATLFGIRIASLSKAEQVSRIGTMVSKTDDIKAESDFQRVAAEAFPEFGLFSSELEALNIGIVGQWFSFGEEVIWKRPAKAPMTWRELQETAPRFFEPTRNPAAVEFWHTTPTDHWYKIYVSDPHADGYSINVAKYDAAINQLPSWRA